MKRTSNAQRRTSNAECRRLNSKLGVERSAFSSYLPAAIRFSASFTSSSADLPCAFAFLLQIVHSLMRIDLLVTERDQAQHCFVRLLLLGRGRVRGAGCFPCRRHSELVF